MKHKISLLGLCVVLMMSACTQQSEKQMQEASQAANRYFQALGAGNIDAALDVFYNRFEEDNWREMLQRVLRELGPYKTRELGNWRVFTGTGARGMGTYITLEYKVKYARREIIEELEFKKFDGQMKIVRHTIDREGIVFPS